MKCTIGIDYGTQSARAILVNIETGDVLEHAVAEYAHPLSEATVPARSWHSCSMSWHKCCYRYIIDSCFIDCFLSKNLKCSI